jgi:predicted protein tyrosine phosphatase
MTKPHRILFICSQNKLRSPTAQQVFADIEGVQALSAGTNHDAETPLSGDLVEWADQIACMEPVHRKKLNRDYAGLLRDTQVSVLGIPDNYAYMDPDLVTLIKGKFARWF